MTDVDAFGTRCQSIIALIGIRIGKMPSEGLEYAIDSCELLLPTAGTSSTVPRDMFTCTSHGEHSVSRPRPTCRVSAKAGGDVK